MKFYESTGRTKNCPFKNTKKKKKKITVLLNLVTKGGPNLGVFFLMSKYLILLYSRDLQY